MIAPVPTTWSCVVGVDERGGVLVEAEADGERVVGERGEQAAEPVALAEVLIDDDAVGEPEARARASTMPARGVGPSSPKAIMCSDRIAAPAEVPPTATPRALRRRIALATGGSAEDRRQPELVAAGEEDAGRRVERLQPVVAIGVARAR